MSGLSIFDPGSGLPDKSVKYQTVTELTQQIRIILEGEFPEVAVKGEISNVSRPRSGHIYCKLKDNESLLDAVIWRANTSRIPFEITDGLEVRARGGIVVYAPQGKYQLNIQKLEPVGMGSLELAFRQRFELLKAEGLFAPERKRKLPRFPDKLAIVTSATGAAVKDMLQVIARRWPYCDIVVIPVRVQGEGAALEIAQGIAMANQIANVEVIITGRGGGSLEDLWAFNEEIVARAIFHSRLPVVTAIGHEIDVTIADYVSDRRALTPSEAGELVVPDIEQVRTHLQILEHKMSQSLERRCRENRTEVDRLGHRLRQAGISQTRTMHAKLDHWQQRIGHAVTIDLNRRRARLEKNAAQLVGLSPVAVLARGYSITQDAKTQTVLRSAETLSQGDAIITRLANGTITSIVKEITPEPRFSQSPQARSASE